MKNGIETNINIEHIDSKRIAEKNFSIWNAALLTRDSKNVAEVYLSEGELLGTVSSKIRKGKEEIGEYFDHFLKINPSGEVVERDVVYFSNDCFLDKGLYDFKVVRGGEEEIIHARFSYVWKKDENGDWKILHHHSSGETEENKDLSGFQPDLGNVKNIQWGIDKEISDGVFLKTGFYKKEDGKIVRFSCVLKSGDIVYSHVSECPENYGV